MIFECCKNDTMVIKISCRSSIPSKQWHGPETLSVCSAAQSCLALCHPTDCSMLGFPAHHQLQSLLKLMSIGLVMPSNHLILCRPLLLPSVFRSTVQGPVTNTQNQNVNFNQIAQYILGNTGYHGTKKW